MDVAVRDATFMSRPGCRDSRSPILAVLAGLLALPAAASALQIRACDPAIHDRFSSGYPGAPVPNPGFLGAAHDFSGVGCKTGDSDRSFTLISTRHYVGAAHAAHAVGRRLQFQGRDGVLRTHTVAANHFITNDLGQSVDLYVGELATPVDRCDEITFYPILDLPTEADYLGTELLVYGRTARLGSGEIAGFHDLGVDPEVTEINETRGFSFVYGNSGTDPDACHAEEGDSGSPSFVAIGGELYVVGVHSVVATPPGAVITYDAFVPRYLDQIDAILGQHGYTAARNAQETFDVCYTVEVTPTADLHISWGGIVGRSYDVDRTSDFLSYVPLASGVTVTGFPTTVIDTQPGNGMRAYRIQRLPLP